MKKITIYLLLLFVSMVFWSCKEDELGPSTIVDSTATPTAFDNWIQENYIKPYNIQLYYKLKDIQTNTDYNIVPPDPEKCWALAKVIKYLWAGTYEEHVGFDFLKAYSFREIGFEGTYRYNSSTITLATASGGIKIIFCGINGLRLDDIKDSEYMTNTYIRTMFHEYTHILNQKKPYSAEFSNISKTDYIEDDWNTRRDTAAYKLGFITPYAGHSSAEDFAETLAYYLTRRATWDQVMNWEAATAATDAKKSKTDTVKLLAKLEIVRTYLKNSWGIEIDELRSIFEQRAANLKDFDLNN